MSGRSRPRRLGLLGGMSWESSIVYERIINTETRRRLGGVHSADLVIRSYDFDAIAELQRDDRWDDAGRLLAADARHLEQAGAEAVLICTNTMHEVADAVQAAVDIPLLHIGHTTADAVSAAGIDHVALLGTRFTMEREFLRYRLAEHGITALVPDEADRDALHRIIYDELVQGVVRDESRERVVAIIGELVGRGAAGVVAGCTEIELLVGRDDVDVPFFPTAELHALAAVDWSLAD